MQLTPFLLLAGVLGTAAAHPSGHAHLHRSAHAHAQRDAPSYVKYVHKPIPKPATSVAPQPTTTSAAAVPAATSASSDVANKYVPFCGSSSSKRATNAEIMYTGELGTENGCPWGSNIMKIADSIASKYQYVQKFTNVASEPYQVVCGNKMGADKQLTGMFKVAGQNQLVFTLAPGASQTVAAAGNTQAICAFAPHEVPTTTDGQFAGVWVEVDFGNTSNNKWSGADCSSLVAQAYGMSVPGCQVSHNGKSSSILPGGQGTNAYTKGMEKADGVGLNMGPGNIVLEVKVGYSG